MGSAAHTGVMTPIEKGKMTVLFFVVTHDTLLRVHLGSGQLAKTG
jgi:hypothetical protein